MEICYRPSGPPWPQSLGFYIICKNNPQGPYIVIDAAKISAGLCLCTHTGTHGCAEESVKRLNIQFPEFDNCSVVIEETILVFMKYTLKYLGKHGMICPTYSQIVQK